MHLEHDTGGREPFKGNNVSRKIKESLVLKQSEQITFKSMYNS
jgi:hypothetical protein